jgi:antitoxin Phd
MNVWPVQDAKARFSELLRAAGERPQVISYRGEPKYEVRRIEPKEKKKPQTLLDVLRACPKVPEFELPERRAEPAREIDFGDD